MPFRKDKRGHYRQVPEGDPRGTHRLPQAPPAFQKIPGLVITWNTPVLPAIKQKPKPKPKTK